jgi:UTP:GlnB (protein PII) uridylyltransferase
LFRLDLDLVAARVQTIGGEVVDSFYLRDPSGSKITDAEAIESLKASVLSVISRRSDGEPIP